MPLLDNRGRPTYEYRQMLSRNRRVLFDEWEAMSWQEQMAYEYKWRLRAMNAADRIVKAIPGTKAWMPAIREYVLMVLDDEWPDWMEKAIRRIIGGMFIGGDEPLIEIMEAAAAYNEDIRSKYTKK